MLEKDGITYSTDISKANILNEHFYSVFTKDHNAIIPEMPDSTYPAMPSIEINNEGIAQLRDPPIMLIFLPIMLCCTAQKFTYYAQIMPNYSSHAPLIISSL